MHISDLILFDNKAPQKTLYIFTHIVFIIKMNE